MRWPALKFLPGYGFKICICIRKESSATKRYGTSSSRLVKDCGRGSARVLLCKAFWNVDFPRICTPRQQWPEYYAMSTFVIIIGMYFPTAVEPSSKYVFHQLYLYNWGNSIYHWIFGQCQSTTVRCLGPSKCIMWYYFIYFRCDYVHL